MTVRCAGFVTVLAAAYSAAVAYTKLTVGEASKAIEITEACKSMLTVTGFVLADCAFACCPMLIAARASRVNIKFFFIMLTIY
ncbi:hypothetical protein D3C87_1760840 [compost metagenome]